MNSVRKLNKRQQAIALKYEQGHRAPHIVASGAGETARRILDIAIEHKIPVHRDDALAELLSSLNVGFEIPHEAYRAVAEILAFLYRTDDAWRKKRKDGLKSVSEEVKRRNN